MDNLTLNQPLNETLGFCSKELDTADEVMNAILLFFSFPATFVVIVKLLSRFYETRSFSSAEIFLLQINLTNVCLSVFHLLLFLDFVGVSITSDVFNIVFYSPTLTARPVFLLAICAIFYLAIVHPVTYMTVKTWRYWEWTVVSFGWLYALDMIVGVTLYETDLYGSIFILLFYNTILPSMFNNIVTLRALSSSGPGNNGQPLNPAKRKAFQIILGILLILVLYYTPRVFNVIYLYAVPKEELRFMCREGSVIFFFPTISEIAMPIIFFYSLRKLGI